MPSLQFFLRFVVGGLLFATLPVVARQAGTGLAGLWAELRHLGGRRAGSAVRGLYLDLAAARLRLRAGIWPHHRQPLQLGLADGGVSRRWRKDYQSPRHTPSGDGPPASGGRRDCGARIRYQACGGRRLLDASRRTVPGGLPKAGHGDHHREVLQVR
jgi:hypothetical protein